MSPAAVFVALSAVVWAEEPPAAPEAAPPAQVRLTADRVVLSAEGLIAEGDVRLTLEGRALVAARLTADPSLSQLTAESLRLSPCACVEGAPWGIFAAEARLDREAELVEVRGLRLMIGERDVAPLPSARLRLTPRQVGVGLPVLGRGLDGVQVALPLWFRPDHGPKLSLSPEWRQARGARGLVSVTAPQASIVASGGWDRLEHAPRAGVSAAVAQAKGGASVIGAGTWISDPTYLSDFGADRLARAEPWTSTRLSVGLGALSVSALGFQEGLGEADLRMSGVVGLGLSPPGQNVGPLTLHQRGRLDLTAAGPRGEAVLQARLHQELGVLELDGLMLARGVGYVEAGEGALDPYAELGLVLPAWADGPRGRTILAFELRGGGGARLGALQAAPTPLTLADPSGARMGGFTLGLAPGLDLAPGGLWAGPRVSVTKIRPEGALSASLDAPITAAGPSFAAEAEARAGALSFGLVVLSRESLGEEAAHLGGARLGLDAERLQAQASLWASRSPAAPENDAELARLGLAAPLVGVRGTTTPSAELLLSAEGLRAVSGGVAWSDPTSCVMFGAAVGWVEDRDGPQVQLLARVTPAR
ncbi:MAG: hypothetical protein IPN01_13450 [Deltaproteobacteria bacterium]|nr:hypothetical protein [Deltaproteobacteria bacterium]